ncbi:MAG: hypothetical protein GTN86_12135 [Xanthomonadales bacterium]|nr:hypothetical protein [Xanthomonadales bacterium]NIN60463.1 hypothetical protein [Xanthomonadales bacterium]NIN75816.1 hypothetical protein [Xanthomonadales bacterium]NIO12994.1 hypothetical protein [Xanthomonadales bacterium]NIP12856.1 hypothetical protein [Xanthomonadales bacterium]
MRYRIFEHLVDCDFPLPELQPAAGRPNLRLRMASGPLGTEDGWQMDQQWRTPAGEVAKRRMRRGRQVLLDFPGQARFLFDEPRRLGLCERSPGLDDDGLRHLLLNQWLPAILGSGGDLVLHAGAVVLPDGGALLLVGGSGYGKSTLTAALCRHGARLMCDDAVLLRRRGGEWLAIPGCPDLRLRRDARDRLFGAKAGGWGRGPGAKFRLGERDEGIERWQGPAPVAAIYLLDDPEACRALDALRVRTPGPAEALMCMVRSAFTLDISRAAGHRARLRAMAELKAAGIPLTRLAYPRHFGYLPQVAKHLLQAQALAPRSAVGPHRCA